MRDLLIRYFDYFSNKDLDNLSLMFSQEVKLQDWELLAEGIDNVMKVNEKIFSSVDTIFVEPKEIFIDNNTAVCLVDILINSKDRLKVVDIIKFDDYGKIKEISAYKQ